FGLAPCGHQLRWVGKIHAKVTRVAHRRTGNAQMNLFSTSFSKGGHLSACGGAAHYRIVYNNNSFAVYYLGYGVVFKLHGGLALALGWFYKSSPHIAIGNDCLAVFDTAFSGIAQRCRAP